MARSAEIKVSLSDIEPIKGVLDWLQSDDLRAVVLEELDDVDWHMETEPAAARRIANKIRFRVGEMLRAVSDSSPDGHNLRDTGRSSEGGSA